jgi:hypothetical protein
LVDCFDRFFVQRLVGLLFSLRALFLDVGPYLLISVLQLLLKVRLALRLGLRRCGRLCRPRVVAMTTRSQT